MIHILDWLWRRAAVLGFGYLVFDWRGVLGAAAAYVAVELAMTGLARWAGSDQR